MVSSPPSTSNSGIDSELPHILRKRRLCSEGDESSHCFVSNPSMFLTETGTASTTDNEDDRKATRIRQVSEAPAFSMDTPPSSRSSSPKPMRRNSSKNLENPEEVGHEDEGSEGGEPVEDEEEDEDGHYDWQFDLLNNLPREKALELAKVLKRSEKDKAQAKAQAARLKEEVQTLRRRSSASEDVDVPVLRRRTARPDKASRSTANGGSKQDAVVEVPPRRCCGCFSLLLSLLVIIGAALTVSMRPEYMSSLREYVQQIAPSDSPVVAEKALEATGSTPPVVQESPAVETMQAFLVASVLPSTSKLHLHHRSLSQDVSTIGDATAELAQALQHLPNVRGAHRLGKVYISQKDLDGGQVALTASLEIGNTGTITWPASTALRLVLGSGLGVYNLQVGQEVPPGLHIELTLQLEVPNQGQGTGESLSRSVWVLEAFDDPFGPLLVLDVHWV